LVARVESTYLTATDYSPAIRPAVVAGERLFELRTYKCEPGRLAALHDRFRQHTLGLFSKHGMTHIGYWTPVEARQGAADTLIYILAHRDQAARDASFKAFRADPDWLAALKASEQKAGGSLTVSNGVTSVMMRATDYSPIR
ncbi:MAG TPA: NIPSNAP family protein, partial [Methylomirabilota bacterium]|nr:NIPSNAP family protein [Methylomirabilota bacterium]